ncbi:hypothetical protein EDD29_6429 [Actinocorallia herbida]|uniref:Uncharacterized protein n=1 Tax=Actinocorallia herbida TaxID=58109 RepID=A0A3N1D5K2_9ACTN|nr:hypothetical protein [Actinocorallia herbida]ROO88750.1 hypothetical protein EDD29_6429 [Actinocorallia herbida]
MSLPTNVRSACNAAVLREPTNPQWFAYAVGRLTTPEDWEMTAVLLLETGHAESLVVLLQASGERVTNPF